MCAWAAMTSRPTELLSRSSVLKLRLGFRV
jgi:hypothetical protein